ncbi:MAG: helix-hairpin-helix domain-containing protein [Candidatus Staskawiczbacteria bacterium]|nr:helix-hairpin-helix domain-containing protein [Candidatus Staskawiczbacteria bacterium]
MANKEIAKIFRDMAELLNIRGDSAFHINAYIKAAAYLEALQTDVSELYGNPPSPKASEGQKNKWKVFLVPKIIGDKNAKKIEEYIKHGKIKEFEELEEETAIRQVITHFFMSKGLSLQELKENAKKRKIIYSRFTKPAKQLLELAGSIEKAKSAIDTVAQWASTRKLDYAIETVFKKWLELDRLKPKEIVKKPFYKGDPMIWSESKKKWFVISKYGEWLEFADKQSTIEWRTIE